MVLQSNIKGQLIKPKNSLENIKHTDLYQRFSLIKKKIQRINFVNKSNLDY